MEERTYTALLVDDHPLISAAYQSAFHHIEKEHQDIFFEILTANTCDSAIAIIDEYAHANRLIDIVFLDMRLPPSKDGKFLSGEDIGLRINKFFPDARQVVCTTFNDNYRVHSILKNLDPDGFLIKNDITPVELVTTIKEVLTQPPYYSKTVIKLLRKQISNDLILDDIDRKILYELSLGTKLKDITEIPLSTAGIIKRKRHLKQIFNIKSADDRELVIIAREKGFI